MPSWLVLLAPLVVSAALVALAMYRRGGPPTAHGFAVHTTPRRRREVPRWAITLLSPLFTYNEHRRAYVLRGIGTRRGPVLRVRRRREEPPPAQRTGRFDRVEAPRAPVGARDRQPSVPPSGEPED
jgi:hypothetical protein